MRPMKAGSGVHSVRSLMNEYSCRLRSASQDFSQFPRCFVPRFVLWPLFTILAAPTLGANADDRIRHCFTDSDGLRFKVLWCLYSACACGQLIGPIHPTTKQPHHQAPIQTNVPDSLADSAGFRYKPSFSLSPLESLKRGRVESGRASTHVEARVYLLEPGTLV